MSPPPISVCVVGAADSPRAAMVAAASQAAELGGSMRHSPDLAAAGAAPSEGPEVLVLLDATAADFNAALAACDARGLPRWAVVPASPAEAAAGSVQWEVPLLAHSLRSAVNLLGLRREIARLRGDLCTVGRRLTHDLRTPLNSISTANQALAEDAVATGSGQELHRSISAAVKEAGGMIERVGSVLLASARPLESEPVDMEEAVWNARQRLDARLRAAGATIVGPANWPVVQGAPALLELVWVNLLANSVQHGGPAPRIELGWQHVGERTCFWLRDSGAGVPVGQQPRLFHPLDRLNELNAPRGYGLSLVQRLVELHGGSAGYDPQPLPGGTFSFTLP